MTKFLTSKKESTNLKNIMAFGEKYFEENRKDIIRNYYQYCEKVTYATPLYCSTKPTRELEKKGERMSLLLLQQTTYYKSKGELEVLYR